MKRHVKRSLAPSSGSVSRELSVLVLFLVALVAGPARAADGTFNVFEFDVSGNTVLKRAQVERAVYPFLGPDKTVEDVRAARSALEKAYRDAGYLTVTVDVPPQKVNGGRVKLVVVDGVISKLAVTGNRYHSRDYIRSRFPALAPGTVPYFPDAQKELAAFNQTSGVSVTPVMRPGAERGAVEMELRVQEQNPLHASVELNNRQSVNTRPWRLSGTLRYDNLWGIDHSISFMYLTAPQDTTQVRAMSGTYLFRVPGSDTLVAFYGVRSRSTVASLGSATVVGNANILGARAIIPVRGASDLTQSVILGVDYKESFQDVSIGTPGAYESTVAYTPFTAQYSLTRQGQKGITRASVSTNFSVRGALFGSHDDEFARRRYRGSADYITLRAELSRQQRLPHDFTGYVRAVMHTASQPLLNTEQFVVTGADSVRGYYEAEVLGDDGWLSTLELRAPSLLGATEGDHPRELIALGFIDAASVRTKSPLPGQASREEPWSVGLGLRYRAEPSLTASMELGIPMKDAQSTRAGDARLHVRLAYDF
ncbi:MAG: BamA/TamA family outer membrane protein [Betaproteobacteria bacterium]|nr:BamA/TamA family outer membrane protein [Betaproteobacteria bacterium]